MAWILLRLWRTLTAIFISFFFFRIIHDSNLGIYTYVYFSHCTPYVLYINISSYIYADFYTKHNKISIVVGWMYIYIYILPMATTNTIEQQERDIRLNRKPYTPHIPHPYTISLFHCNKLILLLILSEFVKWVCTKRSRSA